MTTISLDLPDSLAANLQAKAAALQVSLSDLLTGAAHELLSREGASNAVMASLTDEDWQAIADGHMQADVGEVLGLQSVLDTLDQNA
jgi:predicted transcriptional regulator